MPSNGGPGLARTGEKSAPTGHSRTSPDPGCRLMNRNLRDMRGEPGVALVRRNKPRNLGADDG